MDGGKSEESVPAGTSGSRAAGGRLAWVRRRLVRPLFLVIVLIAAAFLGGFFVFSDHVSSLQKPVSVVEADGIIVLTGGYSRIEAALDLLRDKRGKRLLISGVHPSINRTEIQRVTHSEADLFDCCVDIDRSARDTIGNATETAKWVRANNYRRVIVVTNNYHIPRSMMELTRAVEGVEFIPYPVVNTDLRKGDWITHSEVVRVLLTEYVKYIAALGRFYLPEGVISSSASMVRSLFNPN